MKYILLIIGFVLMALPACAEQVDTAELDEVSVTATKVPRKTSEVSASVEVVTKEEIEQSKAWNVGEAIGSLPGVQAESENGAYDSHIIIRGAGAKASYGVREIMIMVDGVPVTDPDSFTRLDMVDTSDIERIEVVKGPNSTLYGANAAGGVINIITRNPLETQGLNLKINHGSYNSEETHVQYGGSAGDLYYILSGTRRSTDSWREHNMFASEQLNARFNYIIDDKSDLNLSLSYTESDLQLPGSLTKAEFDEDHTQQTSEWVNTGRYSTNKRLALGYNKEFNGGNELITKAYMQDWYHYHPVPYGINDGGAVVSGLDLQLNIPSTLMGKKSLLSVGISGQRDDRDSEKYTYRDTTWNPFAGPSGRVTAPYSSSDVRGELMEADTNIVDKYGVFVQESLWIGEGTILDIGLRHDVVDFDLHTEKSYEWDYSIGNYAAVSDVIDIEESWKRLSPRIGINHALKDGMHVYGSVSTGFQTPTQSELETNLALDPQTTVNYEIGLKGKSGTGHRYEAVVFYTDIEDEVLKLMDSNGDTFYDNAGQTVHKGLEMSGVYKVTGTISLGANYAYSDFYFDEYKEMVKTFPGPAITTISRNGNKIPLVPEHKYTAFIDYRRPEGIYGRLSSNTWDEYHVDTANTETYEGFTVVNAKVGYKQKNTDLYLQAGNIFDKKYAAEVASSYGNIKYSPAAPFTMTVGLSVKL
jgi:iron complex outermembrane receptor protein